MSFVILKNAHLVDPAQDLDCIGSLIVKENKIVAIGAQHQNQGAPENATVIDCAGKSVMPGIIDLRVFLEFSSHSAAQTLKEFSDAAIRGGITAALVMPSDKLPLDCHDSIELFLRRARDYSTVSLYPAMACYKRGEVPTLTEMGLGKKAGARVVTTGEETVQDTAFLRKAMLYARNFSLPFFHETQDPFLSRNAVATEGPLASALGLPSVPAVAERIALQRDLALVEDTKIAYHASQISCGSNAKWIAHAKNMGLSVTAGTSIAHLMFNENDIRSGDSNYKFFPPLRKEEERTQLLEGLRSGVIDVVVSNHKKCPRDSKKQPFDLAAVGAPSSEVLLGSALSFYHAQILPLSSIVRVLCTNPGRLLGKDRGTLRVGSVADFIIVDLTEPWVLAQTAFCNTPYLGKSFQGKVKATFVSGKNVLSPTEGRL